MAREFDNSAFYFFAVSLLALYAVPMSAYTVYRLASVFLKGSKQEFQVRRVAAAGAPRRAPC